MTGVYPVQFPRRATACRSRREPLVASPVKVRELQRALWAAAKQSEGRRFHALYDRVCRGDVLREAWERVRKNRGAAGVDRITLAAVEDYGVDRMLRELRRDLREGVYRPAPARRVEIPKPRGGKRPLGIPDGAGPGGPGGGQDRAGTDFRGGLPVVLVWVSAETVGHASDGAACVPASSRAHPLWWSSISPISSARSTTTGYSPRWVGGSRIGGCSNCCVSGCRQE